MIPSRRTSVLTALALVLPLLALLPSAPAEAAEPPDCSGGFSCGRFAYAVYDAEGATNTIYLVSEDGTDADPLVTVPSPGGTFVNNIRFSPDGSSLLFAANSFTFDVNLFRVGVDGTGLVRLTESSSVDREAEWSPDGSRIVFLSNRDTGSEAMKVYVMDADGSDETRLSTDSRLNSDPTHDIDADPSWSPDGSRIWFSSRRAASGKTDVWHAAPDGTDLTRVTDAENLGTLDFLEQPVVSPDGSRVAFVANRDEGREVWVMQADGSGATRLTTTPDELRKDNLRWLPDSTGLLYGNYVFADGATTAEVFVVPAAGGTPRQLSAAPGDAAADDYLVGVSPDGSRVAIVSEASGQPRRMHTIGIDGTGLVSAADGAPGASQGAAYAVLDRDSDGIPDGADRCPALADGYPVVYNGGGDIYRRTGTGADQRLTTSSAQEAHPSVDAAGSRIAFASTRADNRYEIFTMNADGSEQTRVTNFPGHNSDPSINADGTQVAYRSNRSNSEIFVSNVDGTGETRITTASGFVNAAYGPAFAPDGTRVAFDSQRGQVGNATWDIYTRDLTGGDEKRLTTMVGPDTQASYNRTGTRIVYVHTYTGDAAGDLDLYVMDADGTDHRRLTSGPDVDTEPAFTPDGGHVVFRSDRGGSTRLWSVRLDGTDLRVVPTTRPISSQPVAVVQADSDDDGVGDACDTIAPPTDTDGDGVPDDTDNCPTTPNPDQLDNDVDGSGDACDAVEPPTDTDGDAVPDDTDNCPSTANPGQADTDADGTGDACDPLTDRDGDAIADASDACPTRKGISPHGCPRDARTVTAAWASGRTQVKARVGGSESYGCRSGEVVELWKVRSGPDQRVQRGRTGSDGRRTFTGINRSGRYYVVLPAHYEPRVAACGGDTSPSLSRQ